MPHDSAIWSPPTDVTPATSSATQPTSFQLRFQNKAVIVGKDGSNAQLAASSAQWASAQSHKSTGQHVSSSAPPQQRVVRGTLPRQSAPAHASLPWRGPHVPHSSSPSPGVRSASTGWMEEPTPHAVCPEPGTASMAEVIHSVGFLTPAQERRVLERQQQAALRSFAKHPEDHVPARRAPSGKVIAAPSAMMALGGAKVPFPEGDSLSNPPTPQPPPLQGGPRQAGYSSSPSTSPAAPLSPVSNYNLATMENYITSIKSSLSPANVQAVLESVRTPPQRTAHFLGDDEKDFDSSTSTVPVLAEPPPPMPPMPHSSNSMARATPATVHGQRRRLMPQGPRLEPLGTPDSRSASTTAARPSPPRGQKQMLRELGFEEESDAGADGPCSSSSDLEVEVEEVEIGPVPVPPRPRRSTSRPREKTIASETIPLPLPRRSATPLLGNESGSPQPRSSPSVCRKEPGQQPARNRSQDGPSVKQRTSLSASPSPLSRTAAKNTNQKVTPLKPAAGEEAVEKDRKNGYTPYSLEQYRTLMSCVASQKLGGLGPSDSDEQRAAREKLERQKAYGERVERETVQALESRVVSVVERHSAEVGTGETEKSEGNGGRCGTTPRRRIEQPTPHDILEARKRRERAKAYAEKVPKPPSKAVVPHLGHTTCEELDSFLKNPHGKALSPREKAAEDRLSRLADLEARHQLYQRNVENIRKQLRA